MNGAESSLNDIKKIKQQRVKNANNTIIGHLNIKPLAFAEEIIQEFDIFFVSESKLDNTFPTNLFKINGQKFLHKTEIDLGEVYFYI